VKQRLFSKIGRRAWAVRSVQPLVTILLFLAYSAPLARAASSFETSAVRFEVPPVIDGIPDEKVWGEAEPISGLLQVRPFFGEPSPVGTEILVGYDDTALYVAFRCSDDDPGRIAASVTARDGNFENDDTVVIMFDTYQDGDSGYYFGTNLLGTQFDGTIANNGRTVDERWDAAWENASARTDKGWKVEIRIPFEVMRYTAAEDRNWGINAQRIYPRRLETSVWSGPGQSEWRVSDFGTLASMDPPKSSAKWWEIVPYALGTLEEGGETEGEVGGNVRLRYRSSMVADLTINPDFALVEADVERINLTRFELFVPEKRPFFLEGNERFEQRIRQFYSRRIGDIDGGAKIAGTVGSVDYIALGTRAELRTLLEDGTEILNDADYGVVRVQKSVMQSGNVGLLASNRTVEGANQGSVGADTTLFFTEEIGLTAQFLQVHGPIGDGGKAWFVRPAYDSAALHFHVRFTNLNRGILNDMNAVGFLRDDDRREFDTNLTHSWWFQESTIEKLRAGINYNRYYGQDGTLRSYETDAHTTLNFTNRWNLRVEYEDEFKRFEIDYWNHLATVEFGYDDRAGRSFSVGVSRGRNFGDDIRLYEGNLTFRISDAWNVAYDVTRLEASPDLAGRTTWIHVLRSTYYFTTDLFLKVFLQTNTSIDKQNAQILFVWRILPPFGSLQMAYQRGTSELGQVSSQGDTLFTKLSWVF
jgi:hypothetical protein